MNAASSILGVYKSGIPRDNAVKVHTPDPTKYHDPAAVTLGTTGDAAMAAMMGHTNGYAGWRGTIIPHATELGGSMGHDAQVPVHEVYIDPELNNRAICVDMAQFRSDDARAALAAASAQARAECRDPKDAAVVTWGQFAGPLVGRADAAQLTIKQGNAQAAIPREEPRLPPVQLPGVYVVPKASEGGGQVPSPPPASFANQFAGAPAASFGSAPALDQARSLHAAFAEGNGHPPQAAPAAPPPRPERPMRRVTFELPAPVGQLHLQYHDVVRNGITLVLVYDHNRPMQMVWFPPAPPPPAEPEALAALVHGDGKQPDMLYLVYPTGLSFLYEGREFHVLTIDKEKVMEKGAAP